MAWAVRLSLHKARPRHSVGALSPFRHYPRRRRFCIRLAASLSHFGYHASTVRTFLTTDRDH